jgi:hypothetical protein
MLRYLLALALVGTSIASAAQGEPLRWRFQKGQKFDYLLKVHEVRSAKIGDQTFEMSTDTQYEWQWEVQDIDEQGVATLRARLPALRTSCSGQAFDFHYDSAQASSEVDNYKKKLAYYYDQLRFAEYQIRLRRDGRVVGITGLDKVMSEVLAGTQIADYHGVSLHDDTFAWLLQQTLGTLPPTAADKSWKLEVMTKFANVGPLEGDAAYTLGGEVKSGAVVCREINMQGKQALDLDARWLNQVLRGLFKTSKLSATTCFDPKAGAVEKSQASVHLGGDLKIGQTDKPALLKVTLTFDMELERKR